MKTEIEFYEENSEAIKKSWMDMMELRGDICKTIDSFIKNNPHYSGNEKFMIIARALNSTYARYCSINYQTEDQP